MLVPWRLDQRFHARFQVVEHDAGGEQRIDAREYLQHLERIDVLLASQQHSRATREHERVVAEERADRIVDPPALFGFADVKGVRTVIDRVLANADGLAHPADGGVFLEHRHAAAQMRQPPRGRETRRPGSEDNDMRLRQRGQTRSATTQ